MNIFFNSFILCIWALILFDSPPRGFFAFRLETNLCLGSILTWLVCYLLAFKLWKGNNARGFVVLCKLDYTRTQMQCKQIPKPGDCCTISLPGTIYGLALCYLLPQVAFGSNKEHPRNMEMPTQNRAVWCSEVLHSKFLINPYGHIPKIWIKIYI